MPDVPSFQVDVLSQLALLRIMEGRSDVVKECGLAQLASAIHKATPVAFSYLAPLAPPGQRKPPAAPTPPP